VDAAARHSSELIQQLQSALSVLPECSGLLVAFSGGRDSTVLLHALTRLAPDVGRPLRVVHVNHGLQPGAADWAAHCRDFCRSHGLALRTLDIDATAPRGQSPEAWARQCRYQALARALRPGEVLVTAHHQHDQAETVLLQLLRGAGPKGLSAMSGCAPFGSGWHARPMLSCTRDQIDAYARCHGLQWCDDPSNAQARYDRNFLRHDVLPRVAGRWPAWAATLARAAVWQADAATILAQVAEADLVVAGEQDGKVMVIERLLDLDPARRRNLLRYWLQRCGLAPPHAVQLDEILKAAEVRADADICVRWQGGELRRHRGRLHAMPILPATDPALVLAWTDLSVPLALPLGRLVASLQPGRGLSARRLLGRNLAVRFRQGGERCRPAGRPHSQTLKRLMQDHAIPSWLRPRMPLLYCGGELAAVGDEWVCEPFQAQPGESGWVLAWRIEDATSE
jgi:tRNA(Ile)-lysidine synthase